MAFIDRMLVGIIVLLCIVALYQKMIISSLKIELKESIKKHLEIKSEYDYYYKLSEALWETYRTYDIFPSKFSRRISEMSRYY